MKQRRAGYQELTDPDNERILGTLTSRAWGKLAVLSTRSAYYNQKLEELGTINPLDCLIHEARQSSGSIKGEHRKDLVEGIRGAQMPKQGLGMAGDDEDEPVGL